MPSHQKRKAGAKGKHKTWAAKRSVNLASGSKRAKALNATAAFQHSDSLRRLGSFEGRGEHARTGNRGHE